MAEIAVEKPITIDILDTKLPALSATSDMPIVETKPDASPEAKPAAPEEGKTPAESAPVEKPADPAASDEPEGKPKSQGVQKRIDELVRQREDAERRAEAERQEKLRLLALVEKGGKPEKPAEDEDPEPQRPAREAFAEPGAFESALAEYADKKADWSARRAVKEALAENDRAQQKRQIEQAQKQAQEAYAGRVQKAAEKYPDYKDVAESPNVTVSIPMAHAIMQSEHGPEIAYHLGKNPEEAKRIASLNPVQQLVEVGLIVAKLTATAPATAAPAPKPAVSAAPKPITPLESKSDPVKRPEEMGMDEYAEYAKKRDAPSRRGAPH
jgi:hypothetical protein